MFIIRVLFLMFSYFSVFDKIWCTFFPEHFYRPVGRWFSQKTTMVSVSGILGGVFSRGVKLNVHLHVRFHGRKILEIQRLHMNLCDWTHVQLASFLLHHLSCLISWEVEDWNRLNDIQVLFRFIANMTLCSPSSLFLSFNLVLHCTVDLTLILILTICFIVKMDLLKM